MKGKLICIIGPDGTGKTTQANLLVEYLRQQGVDCEYKWLRFHHFFSLPVLAVARLIGLSRVETLESGKKIGYHEFHKSKFISTIYPYALLIDTFVFTTLKVTIPMKYFGKTIVCDRFVYDTLVDLMISTKNSGLLNSNITKSYITIIPKNCLVMALSGDEKTLRDRREDIKYDKVLPQKIHYYDLICDVFDIPMIDASHPIRTIEQSVRNYALKRCD
ncbi:MAG: hypothetical protein ACOYCB_11880 [Fastidiosipilaceae bacterium]|jgi:thymidylate kinase